MHTEAYVCCRTNDRKANRNRDARDPLRLDCCLKRGVAKLKAHMECYTHFIKAGFSQGIVFNMSRRPSPTHLATIKPSPSFVP